MKSNAYHIWIAETATIIRSGIAAVVNQLPHVEVSVVEITSLDGLQTCMQGNMPDLLIINPLFGGWFNPRSVKSATSTAKVIALVHNNVDPSLLKDYDDTVTIYDTANAIFDKLSVILDLRTDELNADPESLSVREREVIVGVVKGLMNKEIADQLNISIHTVNTHRKNIAKKLQIHSASGLTIYALTNKLVEIDEVKL